jgi:hypothetical protein
MVSEDLEGLFGAMEVVGHPGPIGLEDSNGQQLPCTRLIDFTVEFAVKMCNVTAWVTPALQNTIVDRGFNYVDGSGFLGRGGHTGRAVLQGRV